MTGSAPVRWARVRAVLGAAAIMVFGATGGLFWNDYLAATHATDLTAVSAEFDALLRRFEALRPALPAAGHVGFVNEAVIDPLRQLQRHEAVSALHEIALARYALAPLILDLGLDHRFVIANCVEPSGLAAVDAQPGLVRQRRSGDRIAVYENTAWAEQGR